MSVMPKEPLAWMILFRQQINEIFNYLSRFERKEVLGEHEYVPMVDIFETTDKFVVEIDLPGFERKDLSLSICSNMLVVEGVKREEKKSEDVNYICLERCFGRFCRTIEIPPAVDVNGVKAGYEKGVLSVAFPRLKDKSLLIRDIPIE